MSERSSPVSRSANDLAKVPDLAFSEMTFLKSKRERYPDGVEALQKDKEHTDKRKHRKSSKAADTEAQISRYFTSAASRVKDSVRPQQLRNCAAERREVCNHDSPPSFVELPERPFLGFGSCGANFISPVKMVRGFDPKDPLERDILSSTGSTSYFTWSQSGCHAHSSPPQNKPAAVPLKSLGLIHSRSPSQVADEPGDRKVQSHSELRAAKKTNSDKISADEPTAPRRSGCIDSLQRPRSQSTNTAGQISNAQVSKDTGMDPDSENPKPSHITAIENPQKEKIHRESAHGSNDPIPTNAADPPTQVQKDREPCLSARPVTARPINSRVPEKLDSLDTTLERLLQQCKYHEANEFVIASTKNSRDDDRVHVEQVNTELQDKRSSSGLQKANHDLCDTDALSTIRPVSAVTSHKKLVNAKHGNFNSRKQVNAPRPTSVISRGTFRSFDERSLDNYWERPIPSPRRKTADSRSAWNGYDTLYERQEQRNHPTLLQNRNPAEGEDVQSHEALRWPYSSEDLPAGFVPTPIAQSLQLRNENSPHDPKFDGRLYHTQTYYTNRSENPWQAELWEDQDCGRGAYTNIDSASPVQNHELYCVFSPDQTLGAFGQDGILDQEQARLLEPTTPQVSNEVRSGIALPEINSPPLHNRDCDFTEGVVSSRKRQINAQSKSEDPDLPNFWRPHKLY